MSVSKSGAAKRSRSSVRSSALSRQVRRGLLGSTALVAAAVAASGAAAQSTQPAEGGLIDGPGTFVDSTASGGGVVWNSSSNNPITLSSGVVIHNTTGTGTPHAYAQVSSAGSAVLTNIDPLVLSTTVNPVPNANGFAAPPSVAAVPEPATVALLGGGLALIGVAARRRRAA